MSSLRRTHQASMGRWGMGSCEPVPSCSLGGRDMTRPGQATLPGECKANQCSIPSSPRPNRCGGEQAVRGGCHQVVGVGAARARGLCHQFACQPKANVWGGEEELMFADFTGPWASFPSLLLRAASLW